MASSWSPCVDQSIETIGPVKKMWVFKSLNGLFKNIVLNVTISYIKVKQG